jgi:hypothetical protein
MSQVIVWLDVFSSVVRSNTTESATSCVLIDKGASHHEFLTCSNNFLIEKGASHHEFLTCSNNFLIETSSLSSIENMKLYTKNNHKPNCLDKTLN